MTTTYEVRSQDGDPLIDMTLADGTAKALLDRADGILHLGETDSRGRFKAKGWRGSVGFDPMAPVPVLVMLDAEGREMYREEVPEIGEADPAFTMMGDEDREPPQ